MHTIFNSHQLRFLFSSLHCLFGEVINYVLDMVWGNVRICGLNFDFDGIENRHNCERMFILICCLNPKSMASRSRRKFHCILERQREKIVFKF